MLAPGPPLRLDGLAHRRKRDNPVPAGAWVVPTFIAASSATSEPRAAHPTEVGPRPHRIWLGATLASQDWTSRTEVAHRRLLKAAESFARLSLDHSS